MPMRSKALILAGLLFAMPIAAAEECQRLDWPIGANTAHCTLRIDGRTVIDGDCRISIAPDGREYTIADMNSLTEADVTTDRPDGPLTARWNQGSMSDAQRMVSYGGVRSLYHHGAEPGMLCFKNNRFALCIAAPFLNCDPPPE
jgi:hypothetical protein